MKSLFMVRLTDFKSYFVITDSYDSAAQKVRDYIGINGHVKSIIGCDGSLNTEPQEVKSVELLTDELLY